MLTLWVQITAQLVLKSETDVQYTLLFLTRDGEILLAMKKRGFGKGRWNGVGGKVEQGESIEHAAIREAEEEIGVVPSGMIKVAELTFDVLHSSERKILKVAVFCTSNWQGTPKETDEMAPQWFTLDTIPYDDMWPDDIYWLPKVLEGKLVRASFVFDDNDKIVKSKINDVERL